MAYKIYKTKIYGLHFLTINISTKVFLFPKLKFNKYSLFFVIFLIYIKNRTSKLQKQVMATSLQWMWENDKMVHSSIKPGHTFEARN